MIAFRALAAAVLLGAGLTGCVAPVGPVEVTRFHLPDTSRLGHGTIAVVPGPEMDAESLEFRSYAEAVSRQLSRLGYTAAGSAAAGQIAMVSLERNSLEPEQRNPVSVGVGGGAGSYGSGVGVGLGIDLSGPPPAQVETELRVVIRDAASGIALWEGRASFSVSAKSPMAQTQLGAPKLAEALFSRFPGTSGETIRVE